MTKKIACFIMVCATLASVHLAEAQSPEKMMRIGYLNRDAGPSGTTKAFLKGLRDLGWIEGKNITIEYRWAAYKMNLLPALAEDLVRLKVDLIVTATGRVTRAAKNATTTIPIVMMYAADAVERGTVKSLARPGGNITGLSEQHAEVNTKLLEVLHDTLPKVNRVGYLWDPDSTTYTRTFRAAQAVAPGLGLTLQSLALRTKGRSRKKTAEELEGMLPAAAQERAGALVVMSRLYKTFGLRIADFSTKNRVPVFSVSRGAVKEYSGLLSYSWDGSDMARRAATYVDKILKGAKPADLPVQRPVKFKLVVNLKTAKQLGITIPPNVLYRATEVIK